MEQVSRIVERVLEDFAQEFIKNPYLCYTEHGLHALFFQGLYCRLSEDQRLVSVHEERQEHYLVNAETKRMCVVQKEYPTAHCLGRSKKQHWDVSVVKSPAKGVKGFSPAPDHLLYDHLHLAAVVEFGLNSDLEHLEDDVDRLSKAREKGHIDKAYIMHLYRLCEPGEKTSRRDLSYGEKVGMEIGADPDKGEMMDAVKKLSEANRSICFYYAGAGPRRRWLYKCVDGKCDPL